MSTVNPSAGQASVSSMPFNTTAVLRTFARHKKAIFWTTFGATLLAVAVSLVIPPTYTATATLLPPQQPQSSAGALLSQLNSAAGVVAGSAGLKSPSDLYVGILKSRTIADDLVKSQGLLAVYDTDSAELARLELKGRTTISAGKEGLISISVEDHDKVRAAQIANTYVDALSRLTKVLALSEASHRRLFFEKQLEASKNNLASAELALKRGLNTKGVISVDADSRTALETIARLRARISAKEVELNAMKSFVTEKNIDFQRGRAELGSLRAELATLEYGDSPVAGATADTEKREGLESIRMLREVKYHQMLYELLAKQFEAARLEEARDAAVVQVLDRAIPPEKRSKPRRAVLVLLTASIALLFSLAFFYWVETRKHVLGPDFKGGPWSMVRQWANGIA